MRKSSEVPTKLEPEEIRATFVAPRSLIKRFHLIARSRDLTFSQEIRRLAREYVEEGELDADQEREAA